MLIFLLKITASPIDRIWTARSPIWLALVTNSQDSWIFSALFTKKINSFLGAPKPLLRPVVGKMVAWWPPQTHRAQTLSALLAVRVLSAHLSLILSPTFFEPPPTFSPHSGPPCYAKLLANFVPNALGDELSTENVRPTYGHCNTCLVPPITTAPQKAQPR